MPPVAEPEYVTGVSVVTEVVETAQVGVMGVVTTGAVMENAVHGPQLLSSSVSGTVPGFVSEFLSVHTRKYRVVLASVAGTVYVNDAVAVPVP